MREIDYDVICARLREMINLLEYDSMRSAGKAKLNSQHLHSMYWLLDKYEPEAKKKPAPTKKGG